MVNYTKTIYPLVLSGENLVFDPEEFGIRPEEYTHEQFELYLKENKLLGKCIKNEINGQPFSEVDLPEGFTYESIKECLIDAKNQYYEERVRFSYLMNTKGNSMLTIRNLRDILSESAKRASWRITESNWMLRNAC